MLLASAPLWAQAPVRPIRSDKELLGKIESIGAGSAVTQSPLGAADVRRPETPRPPKKEGSTQGKPGETEITSEEGTFDNRTHQAIFSGNVAVKNPDFNLTADKLTAYLKAQKAKAVGAEARTVGAEALKPGATPRLSTGNGATDVNVSGTPRSPDPNDKAGGLEKAIAEGNVIITRERVDSAGAVARDIGRGKKAVYEASSGDVILTGKPEVQQGINTCVALDENTIMILNRNGQMKTIGPSKVVIRDNDSSSTPANGR